MENGDPEGKEEKVRSSVKSKTSGLLDDGIITTTTIVDKFRWWGFTSVN